MQAPPSLTVGVRIRGHLLESPHQVHPSRDGKPIRARRTSPAGLIDIYPEIGRTAENCCILLFGLPSRFGRTFGAAGLRGDYLRQTGIRFIIMG